MNYARAWVQLMQEYRPKELKELERTGQLDRIAAAVNDRYGNEEVARTSFPQIDQNLGFMERVQERTMRKLIAEEDLGRDLADEVRNGAEEGEPLELSEYQQRADEMDAEQAEFEASEASGATTA